MKSVKDYIISIPDFPSKGIIFRDVTSVLESPEGYALAIDELNKLLDGVDYDLIAGTESRGFIFGLSFFVRLHTLPAVDMASVHRWRQIPAVRTNQSCRR